MPTFEIEGHPDPAPRAPYRVPAAQRKLAKAKPFVEDPDDGFHRTFAYAINGWPNRGVPRVRHLDLGPGLVRWRGGGWATNACQRG